MQLIRVENVITYTFGLLEKTIYLYFKIHLAKKHIILV